MSTFDYNTLEVHRETTKEPDFIDNNTESITFNKNLNYYYWLTFVQKSMNVVHPQSQNCEDIQNRNISQGQFLTDSPSKENRWEKRTASPS